MILKYRFLLYLAIFMEGELILISQFICNVIYFNTIYLFYKFDHSNSLQNYTYLSFDLFNWYLISNLHYYVNFQIYSFLFSQRRLLSQIIPLSSSPGILL